MSGRPAEADYLYLLTAQAVALDAFGGQPLLRQEPFVTSAAATSPLAVRAGEHHIGAD